MQPEQQRPDVPPGPPAPPPMKPTTITEQNRYDFIMNPNNPQAKPLIPVASGSKKNRIIAVAAGAVFLLIIGGIFFNFLSNAGKADTEALIRAAKQQQELIRIADIGIEKSRGQQAKNLAVTTKLSLASEQDDMQNAIKAAGLNPKKVLTGSANAQTTQQLTTAEQNNRFDEEFIKVMTESLTSYQRSVKAAYDGATSKKLKEALATQYKSANALAGVKQTE